MKFQRSPQAPRLTAILLTLGLAGFWIWSAAAKLLDWTTFSVIASAHDILPPRAIEMGALWGVPLSELALGFLIAAFGHRSPAKWLIFIVATLMITAYSTYILLIPSAALKVVGCGCRGSRAPIESPLWPLVLNSSVLAFHFLLNLLPQASPTDASLDPAPHPV